MRSYMTYFWGKKVRPEDKSYSIEGCANLYTLYCLNYALGASVFVWILNILNIFIVEQKLMLVATLLALALLLAPKLICMAFGVEGGWVKYCILFFTSTAIAVYGVALSYHAVLLFVLPLCFAAQYRSKKVISLTYVYVLFVLLLSVAGSFWLGLCDMNMLLLSAYPTSHYADLAAGELFDLTLNTQPWITIPLFFFVPRALILLLFIPVLIHLVDMSAENAVVAAELRRLSETDRTTRFYNKNKFDQMLLNYYPDVEKIGVIFWNLNNLKTVNDHYGHMQGDVLISAMADCISELVVNMRQVFRIGGDSFVMMIEDPDEGEIEQVILTVRERLEQRNAVSRIPISFTEGWAEGVGENAAVLVGEADRNMYALRGASHSSDMPDYAKDTMLNDNLFEGLASVADNVYLYICDMQTKVSRWSQGAVEYFDLPGEFLTDVGDVWLHRIHPEDRKIYLEEITDVFNGKRTRHRCEYRVMNRYGEYIWLESRGNVIYDKARKTRYFSGIMLRMDNRNKYDPLTKLKTFYEFNNTSFDGRTGSLLLMGMDDFRMVVNNFGYVFGDMVLAEFAQRLTRFCGEKYIPYRMEGDEFLIMSPGADEAETRRLFDNIRALGYGLGREGGQLINVRFSCGAVLYPDHGTTRETLVGNLEHSLELAKSEHRGEVVFFRDDIAVVHQHALIIKEKITQIVNNGFDGLTLNFQPLVRKDDRRIVSCEVLLRCNELKNRGVGIEDVIDYLERNGEILLIGRWVAEQVFLRARRWQREYPDLSINFNISAVQLQHPGFVEEMISLSRRYSVDPIRIVIEITESSRIEDYYITAQYLSRLREYGFKIALDDFGIAYSTLLLIKTLPTDYVKIDHSFVLHLHRETSQKDLIIIEAVIDLCRRLDIQVVAEGVGSEETLRILEAYPIALFQGYYFSKPLPEEEFLSLLRREQNP